MKTQAPPSSVLDVLDRFFGDTWGSGSVDRLSDAELLELAEAVDDYYSTTSVREPAGNIVRHYSGGNSIVQPPAAKGSLVRAPTLPSGMPIPFSPSALLYADELAINCPVDSWVCRHRGSFVVPRPYRAHNGNEVGFAAPSDINEGGFWQSSTEKSREALGNALGVLADFDVAIRSGWIVLLPHLRYWKRQEQAIWTQVRHDVLDPSMMELIERNWKTPPALSDWMRGGLLTVSGGYIPQDHSRALVESPSLYFNGTLAMAHEGNARFLPTADSDYGLLEHQIQKAAALKRELREALLIHSMDTVLAPEVSSHNLEDVFSIRADTGSFADWRAGLESVISGATISASADLDEAHGLVVEKLTTLIESIRREGRTSQSLGSRLSRSTMEGIDVGIAAVVCLLPVDTLSKIVGGLAALLKVAVQSARSNTGSRSSVLLKLDRAGVTNRNL